MSPATSPIVRRLAEAIINRRAIGEYVTRQQLISAGFTPADLDTHFEAASAIAGRDLAASNRSDD